MTDTFVFPPMPPAVIMHDKVGPLFDRLSMQFYAQKCMSIAATPAAPSADTQDERGAFTDQQIYDEFSFLEGLVSEVTYRNIADKAIEIARAAPQFPSHPTDAAAPAQAGEPVAEIVASHFVQGGIAVKLLDQTLPVGAPLYAAPQPSQPVEAGDAQTLYVECRECKECGHIGMNDSHATDAACGYSCGWSGPSPVEDKCPDCSRENVMRSACPKCSGLYTLIAEGNFPVAPSAVVLDDERAAFVQAAIRMLEGYAESYDCMSRMNGGENKVNCSSVAFDIRHNMVCWIKARAASPQASQPATLNAKLDKADRDISATQIATATQPAQIDPATDPRDDFEKLFRKPSACERCGDGYTATAHGAWQAREFINKWEGFKAALKLKAGK